MPYEEPRDLPAKRERTLVVIQPDAVQRGIIGHILTRIEMKGLVICSMRMAQLDRPSAEKLYKLCSKYESFSRLINYAVSGPVVILVLEGPRAIKNTRNIVLGVRQVFGMKIESVMVMHSSREKVERDDEMEALSAHIDNCNKTRADIDWIYDDIRDFGPA